MRWPYLVWLPIQYKCTMLMMKFTTHTIHILSVHGKNYVYFGLFAVIITAYFPNVIPHCWLCLTAEPISSVFSKSVYLSKLIKINCGRFQKECDSKRARYGFLSWAECFFFFFFYFSLHLHTRTKFINSAWCFSRVLRPDSSELLKEQCRVQWSALALSASNLGLLNLTSHL